jgi:hypothetical protein
MTLHKRFDGNADDFRSLGGRQLFQVAQNQHLAVRRRKRSQGA